MVTQARCTFCGPRPALSHPNEAIGRDIASEAWISGHGGCLSKRQNRPKVWHAWCQQFSCKQHVSWERERVREGRCASGAEKVSASRWGSGDEIFTNGRVKGVVAHLIRYVCQRGRGVTAVRRQSTTWRATLAPNRRTRRSIRNQVAAPR